MTTHEDKPSTKGAASTPLLKPLFVGAAVCALTVVALVFIARWGWYRYRHVVLSQAVVKGTVTRLGARIDGRIKSIEVDVGQRVAKGDILVRMEDSGLQAALARVRAELDAATQELNSDRLGVEQARRRLTQEIERVKGARKKASGELEAAKGNLASLEKQYQRVATLLKSGAAATSEMDRITGERDHAQGMVDAASGVLDTAESNYQRAMIELDGVQVREAHLQVLESQVVVARARLAQAESDLEATVLRAPADGQVLERMVELGGSAKVGEPVLSLWLGSAWVEAWADERDLRKFNIGNRADIAFSATPGRKFAGRVQAIGPVSDKQLQPTPVPPSLHSFLPPPNAMVPVRIAFSADEDCRLQLGLSVLVGIEKNRSANNAREKGAQERFVQGIETSFPPVKAQVVGQ